jgi:hypothetical protein
LQLRHAWHRRAGRRAFPTLKTLSGGQQPLDVRVAVAALKRDDRARRQTASGATTNVLAGPHLRGKGFIPRRSRSLRRSIRIKLKHQSALAESRLRIADLLSGPVGVDVPLRRISARHAAL